MAAKAKEQTAAKPQIANFEFDVEADRKANLQVDDRLASMGIRDAEDLGPWRVDVGLVSQHMNRIDPDDTPERMENNQRLNSYLQAMHDVDPSLAAGIPQAQPGEPQSAVTEPAPADPLSQLQVQLDAAQAEAKRMKEHYSRESERWGTERKRNAERLARLEQGNGQAGYPQTATTYTPQPAGYYDPRILGDVDPNAPLTAAQTATLLQSMAAAFGSQMTARDNNVIEAAREMRHYDLTTNEEADLIERHGWLTTLDRASQVKAMRDLVQPLRAASPPAAATPPKPQGVNLVDLARARHLTATTFIEPSSRGSVQETAAATGADSALSKKIAEYKTALSLRPGQTGFEADQYGANRNAERLLHEINALQRRR